MTLRYSYGILHTDQVRETQIRSMTSYFSCYRRLWRDTTGCKEWSGTVLTVAGAICVATRPLSPDYPLSSSSISVGKYVP